MVKGNIRLFSFVVFMLFTACATKAPVFGLMPEYPENRTRRDRIVFVEVDSVQPTFQWDSFTDSKVTYDFKVWGSKNDYPEAVIYSRQGLSEPYHKIELPLEPCTKYFWTLRARFELNGQPRATEWGISAIPAASARSPVIPNPNLYRFKTPCPKTSTDKR